MTHPVKGSAVARGQIIVLDDGEPAVLWTENRAQELLSGSYRDYDPSQFGHTIADWELKNLIASGAVERFSRQFVWLTAMPDRNRFGFVAGHTDASSAPIYFVHTALPASALAMAQDLIRKSDLHGRVDASIHAGLLVFTGPGGHPFLTLEEAEAAQMDVARLAPELTDAVVAFEEGEEARRATNEMVAALLEDSSPNLSFEQLAASQSGTPVTEGKCAVIIGADSELFHALQDALIELDMQAVDASDEIIFEALQQGVVAGCQPAVFIADFSRDDITAAEQLIALSERAGFEALPVIVLADAMASDSAQIEALRAAGAHLLFDQPMNASRVRLKVFEVLQVD